MCCVMPPNSPATTSVSRIASSSLVLPWSTWPITVTTGGRGTSCDSSTCSSMHRLGDLLLEADDLGSMPELGRDERDRRRRTATWWRSPSRRPGTGSSRSRRVPLPTFSAMSCGVAPRTTRRVGTSGSAGVVPRAGAARAPGRRRRHRRGRRQARADVRRRRSGGAVGAAGRRRRQRRGRSSGAVRGAAGAVAAGAAGGSGFASRAWRRRPRFLALGFGLRGAGGGSSTSRRFGASVALPPEARSRGTRSSGTLDEADLPVTPICSSVASNSLLVTPSSFASSWTLTPLPSARSRAQPTQFITPQTRPQRPARARRRPIAASMHAGRDARTPRDPGARPAGRARRPVGPARRCARARLRPRARHPTQVRVGCTATPRRRLRLRHSGFGDRLDEPPRPRRLRSLPAAAASAPRLAADLRGVGDARGLGLGRSPAPARAPAGSGAGEPALAPRPRPASPT